MPSSTDTVVLISQKTTSLTASAATVSKNVASGNPIGYNETLVNGLPGKRALIDPPDNANYIRALNPTCLSQRGLVSGHFFSNPNERIFHAIRGVNGLTGCTSVIVASTKDVYISHIWEEPLFMQGYDWTPADDAYFAANVFNVLRDGNENTQAISSFIGMDTNLGPLNHIYSPKVFVVTPYTTDFDEARFGITTPLRYQARVEQLAKDIIRTIPGSDFAGSGLALGYVRTDIDMATARGGIASRAIWEADPQQFWLAETNSQGLGVRIGRWRLWVED